MTQRHVLVLAGGLTHERDVSLRSGARITDALRRQGHEVTVRDVDSGLIDWLGTTRPDAAVLALHGGRGENGAIQGVLTMSGVPHVGTPSPNCRLAWDKSTAKSLLLRAGFSTPDWMTLAHDTFRDLGAGALDELLVRSLGLPLMVKPYQGGSALGCAVVRDPAELPHALVGAFAYGSVVLIERYVAGIELAITVVDRGDGPVAMPAVEIDSPGDFFSYDARYTAGLTRYYTPARLGPEVADAAADLAVAVHRELGLRDISRTDAIVDADGTVHFLEVAIIPGFTETSLAPMSIAAAGLDLGDVYSELVELAIARSNTAGVVQ